MKAGVFVSVKINIKKKVSSCEQNMAGLKKYSLTEAVDLVLQADSDSGSEPEVNSSKWQSKKLDASVMTHVI